MASDLEPVPVNSQKHDPAWKHCHMYKSGDKVQLKCIYCGKMFKGGGIHRIKEHLAGQKGNASSCLRVQPDVRLLMQDSLNGVVVKKRKKQKLAEEITNFNSGEADSFGNQCAMNTEVVMLPDAEPEAIEPSSSLLVNQEEEGTESNKRGGGRRKKGLRVRKGSNALALNDSVYDDSKRVNHQLDFEEYGSRMGPARSSTDFSTLKRMVSVKHNLQSMVTSEEWMECSYSKKEEGYTTLDYISNPSFWSMCTVITHLTDPFLRLLRIIRSSVYDCVERLVPDTTIQDKIVKETTLYREAAGDFGRKIAIRGRDTLFPAEWWSTYGGACPNLVRLAVRILSQTCSLVGCKPNKIPFQHIHETKNYVEHQRLGDIVFVQYNMRLKQMFYNKEQESPDPISYDNINSVEAWVNEKEIHSNEIGRADWMIVNPPIGNVMILGPEVDDIEVLGEGFDDHEIFDGLKGSGDENGENNVLQIDCRGGMSLSCLYTVHHKVLIIHRNTPWSLGPRATDRTIPLGHGDLQQWTTVQQIFCPNTRPVANNYNDSSEEENLAEGVVRSKLGKMLKAFQSQSSPSSRFWYTRYHYNYVTKPSSNSSSLQFH
ncbi:hypothetical protein L1987_35172 [Smallanthus sonchifolius]|uniref:Uncharacterized protein n=1 Tax=Smallanthus sonchifolius TaxID=185202 RepID=A0ACB9HVL2_9ASTR|nr:hypothetical protein L1987_35172 [Smallanthus sonchifolius]